MKIIIHQGEKSVTIPCEDRMLLSQAASLAGCVQDMPCGGKARCGKCRVRVAGAVSEPTAQELKLLSADAAQGIRLSCMTYAEGDCEVFLPSVRVDAVAGGSMPEQTDTPMGGKLGVAVDIGTTTVAVYLYDFAAKKLLSQETFKNPQEAFGADVISRIQADLDGQAPQMQRLIVQRIDEAAAQLCKQANVSETDIDAAVITGNTTMLCLLTLVSTEPLSHAPFEINDYFGRNVPARELGFAHIGCPIYLPRTMSAFVGSDITCAMLSSDFGKLTGPAILADIGTNGEMAIVRQGKRFACSTAAGPAFEGAGITFGSVARAGAIDKVWVEDGKILYTTLHGAKAVGLCGSGLIDAVAAFIEAKLIDETGMIDECNEEFADYLDEYEDMPALRVGDSGILLTQKDVRTVQLAKSAICAGLQSLMNATGIRDEEVKQLIIAGGFGAYLNINSAAAIGLIPPALRDCAGAVGNAAGMGALKLLLGADRVPESDRLAAETEVLDLSTSPYFMDKYVENMMFEV